ncbi:hypothetical protein [Allostreptomyces psammosilenae]|uniref:Uncharacterized protein n=1 Tax=Allostreptomyces psammosilenae TaxID=1892865 RepID=A0A853A269_9ACTN|nr:hypothetical protein [Allostreptomyces psammosilenae]NYI06984.1 hypothetical protein [Allostreptomyces psammosilenae]
MVEMVPARETARAVRSADARPWHRAALAGAVRTVEQVLLRGGGLAKARDNAWEAVRADRVRAEERAALRSHPGLSPRPRG